LRILLGAVVFVPFYIPATPLVQPVTTFFCQILLHQPHHPSILYNIFNELKMNGVVGEWSNPTDLNCTSFAQYLLSNDAQVRTLPAPFLACHQIIKYR
jgi:hypothetical protein